MAGEAVDSAVKRLVFPSFTLLESARQVIGQGIELGGQDCHHENKGAHTGDISAEMLVDAGCSWVLLGHSERRQNHNESGEIIAKKFAAAEAAGLSVMLCVGEKPNRTRKRQSGRIGTKNARNLHPPKNHRKFRHSLRTHLGNRQRKNPNPQRHNHHAQRAPQRIRGRGGSAIWRVSKCRKRRRVDGTRRRRWATNRRGKPRRRCYQCH